jgi:hypothetical protein
MQANTPQHPSRPLFFVAHSIGGLVVKILLLKAKVPQYRTIIYNCHGVAFFGGYNSPLLDFSVAANR